LELYMKDIPVFAHIEDLGERLAKYRLSRNLRQSDIASKAGISRGVIARLEAGQGGTVDSLVRVMKALDIDDRIVNIIPDARISPLDTRQTKPPRQRSRPQAESDLPTEPWTWAED
jgi:transcriptional regulator with XRE-family HTH domain